MDNMGPLVLGPRAGNGPSPCLLVEFAPSELGHLFAPLTGQSQKLDDGAIRRQRLARSEYDLGELLVAKHPIAANFSVARGKPLGGRRINDSATHAPAKEGLQGLKEPMAGIGIALCHEIEEVTDISFIDLMNAL